MNPTDIPTGVCRCRTVKHAIGEQAQATTRELIRMATANNKPDLVDCYTERLTHCPTANKAAEPEQVAS
jgi:hypothetical protein